MPILASLFIFGVACFALGLHTKCPITRKRLFLGGLLCLTGAALLLIIVACAPVHPPSVIYHTG